MNYKETNLTGTSWTRCKSITITNPLANDPTPGPAVQQPPKPIALFNEETVTQLSNNSVSKQDTGYCSTEFNPISTIPLIDTETGAPTGETVTHAELYRILFSLYMQTATSRDALQ